MDFSNMLQYLQSLLSKRQQQGASQFGQNLGLQQQELGQQGSQFNSTLALQQKAQDEQNALENARLQQQGGQFNSNLDFQKTVQEEANKLASQGQQWNQGFQDRMNVTPGSGAWIAMQEIQNPNSISNLAAKANLNRLTAQQAPISKVNFTPAGNEWRLS